MHIFSALNLEHYLCCLKLGGNKEKSELPDGSKRCFSDLMSHHEEIEKDSESMFFFEGFYSLLKVCLSEKCPNRQFVFEIFGKMLVNSFDIMNDTSDRTIGQGLYFKASAIDHSCYPNASWTSNGKELIIRAIDDIAQFSDIRISYITRHSALKSAKY